LISLMYLFLVRGKSVFLSLYKFFLVGELVLELI
jgi:hypothetical protein